MYRDVRYPQWKTIVELDGREAHPPDEKFRDLRRDNRAAIAGDASLRYGWRDVAGDPCAVAAQVALLLTNRGGPEHPNDAAQPAG
jgi:very-short-patch-repair endonuclease